MTAGSAASGAQGQAGTNWFDQGGEGYARFRPDYPDRLAEFLADAAPDRELAIDVGCGTGQFSTQLAACFDAVLALDPSADQIAHAAPHPQVRYDASAEQLPAARRSASLIAAAQAAHWFDRPRFYDEARRAAKPGAVLALISYGVAKLDPAVDARFQHFYAEEMGRYWPPERRLVDGGYAGIDFPFAPLPTPAMDIVRHWSAEELLGYISTWSAVRKAREAGREDLLRAFAADLGALWGDPETKREVRWPINMRLGTLD